MLEKTLQSLGLGNKEQVVYKLILERGKIAPSLLSRLAGINRTTIYSVAKELQDKGLISEDLGGKTLYYIPSREHELEKIIAREKEKAQTKENSIRELQEFLKTVPESKTFSVPRIRFVDERDLRDYLYEATPRWVESGLANNPTWWGYQDHTFVEHYQEWVEWFWKRAPERVDLKLFSNESPVEAEMRTKNFERRQIRFWNGNSEITGTQWIVGAYIILILTKEKPFYLVEIHDSVMAHNMREVFKKLWETVK